MSSNSTSQSNSDTFKGYVHLVSEINTSANGKTKYFNLNMWTSPTKTVYLVCYSPEKRRDLKQGQDNRLSLEISATVKSPNKRLASSKEEYTITKKSKITPTELDFDYDESFSNRYHTLKEASDAAVYTTIDVKVKIKLKPEEKESLIVRGTTKFKVDAIVADGTNSMKLALWENCIDKVRVSKSYHVQNCKVHVFNDTKFLSRNDKTVINEIDAITDDNVKALDTQEYVITAKCIGLEVNRHSSCSLCNKKIAETSRIENEMVTCTNCNITILANEAQTKLICQLVLKTVDGKVTSYTAFNDAMQSFLNNVDTSESISNIDTKTLKLLVRKSGEQKMVVDKSVKVIAQFLPESQDTPL